MTRNKKCPKSVLKLPFFLNISKFLNITKRSEYPNILRYQDITTLILSSQTRKARSEVGKRGKNAT